MQASTVLRRFDNILTSTEHQKLASIGPMLNPDLLHDERNVKPQGYLIKENETFENYFTRQPKTQEY